MKDPETTIPTLRTELTSDVSALERIHGRMQTPPETLRTLAPTDPIVTAASFEVHNYYSVSENLMRRVATAFENALDPSEWHKQLLARMSLDIQGIRPALMDPALRIQLDELRKFRHFFRNAYDRQLDPVKVAEILQLLLGLHGAWIGAIGRFLDWLEQLAARLGKAPPSIP